MALIFMALLLAAIVTVLYCCLIVASNADDRMDEIMEERIMTNTTPVPAPAEPWVRYNVPLDDSLQQYIEEQCKEYGVPSPIVMAVIGVESNFDPNCKGDVVDGYYQSFGLMQIYAKEHYDRCIRLNAYNLLDPYQNVRVGIDFLAELIDIYDGDWDKALSFYNNDDTGRYAEKVQAYAECLAEGVMQFNE